MNSLRYLSIAALVFVLGCSDTPQPPPETPPEQPPTVVIIEPTDSMSVPEDSGGNEPTAPRDPEPQPESQTGSLQLTFTDDPAVEFLAKVASSDPLERGEGRDEVAALGEDALPLLLAGLRHTNAQVRRGAAAGLRGRYRRPPAEVIEAMIVSLDDPDDFVRGLALDELAALEGNEALPAVPRLARELVQGSETSQNRRRMARLIGKQGPAAAGAIPQLIEGLHNDPDANVRGACLYALWCVAEAPSDALDALRQVLRTDDSATLRRVAAMRIGGYGPAAVPAAEDLAAALEDENDEVQIAAAGALARLGPAVVPLLVARLDDPRAVHHSLAALTLGQMGPDAAAAVPALRPLLEDESEQVRLSAQAALQAIGAAQ